MLPQETIKNFAHRLNVLSSKVYTNIKDKESIDHIKFVKFVACLPSNIRVKLQEEDIKTFDKAVDRAQILQDIFVQEQILIQPATHSIDSVQEQLTKLTEKINYLTLSDKNKSVEKSPESFHERSRPRKDYLQSNFKSRSTFNSGNRFRRQQNETIRCQLCHRRNHTADTCFKWQRFNRQNQRNLNYREDDNRKYNSNNHNSNRHNLNE